MNNITRRGQDAPLIELKPGSGNLPRSRSHFQGQMSRMLMLPCCTTLCGNELLYPFSKGLTLTQIEKWHGQTFQLQGQSINVKVWGCSKMLCCRILCGRELSISWEIITHLYIYFKYHYANLPISLIKCFVLMLHGESDSGVS